MSIDDIVQRIERERLCGEFEDLRYGISGKSEQFEGNDRAGAGLSCSGRDNDPGRAKQR